MDNWRCVQSVCKCGCHPGNGENDQGNCRNADPGPWYHWDTNPHFGITASRDSCYSNTKCYVLIQF